MKLVLGVLSWLGGGFLLHWIILGAQLDWSSAATYACLFGWPIFVCLALLAAELLFFAFALLLAAGVIAYEKITGRA